MHDAPEIRRELEAFLLIVLRHIVDHLEEDSLEMHGVLSRVLNTSMGFYLLPKDHKHQDFEPLAEAMEQVGHQ